MTELEKGALQCQEQDRGDSVNAEFHPNKRSGCSERDIMSCAELGDEMDDQFLNELRALGNTGDKSGHRSDVWMVGGGLGPISLTAMCQEFA